MTTNDFKEWAALTQTQQIARFKSARRALELTQKELINRLKVYGYMGSVKTIEAWEQGLRKIPVLVYELIYEGFAERKK